MTDEQCAHSEKGPALERIDGLHSSQLNVQQVTQTHGMSQGYDS
jgi:hypothetical protein